VVTATPPGLRGLAFFAEASAQTVLLDELMAHVPELFRRAQYS
jgi:hypothetical protein